MTASDLRPYIRRALRAARHKGGADERQISKTLGDQLISMGLLREVVERVYLSGGIAGRRYMLTPHGHAWLDDDTVTPLAPEVEEDETR